MLKTTLRLGRRVRPPDPRHSLPWAFAVKAEGGVRR